MKRVVALIMVAIVLAAATGVASYVYLQNAEQHVMAGLVKVTVLETNSMIPAGTTYANAVSQKLIGTVEVPAKFAVADMLKPGLSINSNYVAGRDLPAGRLLFTGDFLQTAEVNRILPIPAGMVAVSFPMPAANRLGPFLAPGDHVVLLDSKATAATPANPAATAVRIIFTDLLVLAVNNVSAMGTGSVDGAPGLVTVAVPQDSAPQLIQAINGNSLYLALHAATVGAL